MLRRTINVANSPAPSTQSGAATMMTAGWSWNISSHKPSGNRMPAPPESIRCATAVRGPARSG